MLADDLPGRIALDHLGTGVPVGDLPVLIEHVDRIVLHALHEHSEPLLALEERALALPLLRYVAGDLGKADQFPVRRTDRVDHHVRPESRSVLADSPAFGL